MRIRGGATSPAHTWVSASRTGSNEGALLKLPSVISAQANQESLLSMVTNLHVESLTSGAQNVAVIGDEGLSREGLNEVTGVGPQPTGLGSL